MLIPAALVGLLVFLYGLFTMDSSQVRCAIYSLLPLVSKTQKHPLWWLVVFFFPASYHVFVFLPVSKEICEANTTIMCPMCEDTCEPWTLSDSCVYAKVSVPVRLTYKLQSFLLWVCRCQCHKLNCHSHWYL